MSRFNIDFVILIKRNLYVDYIRNLRKKMEINKKDKYYKSFSIFTADNQLIKSNHYNKINSIINGFYIYIA